MNKAINSTLSLILMASLFMSCQNSPKAKTATEEIKIEKPLAWSRNANIYEVNIRQYTP